MSELFIYLELGFDHISDLNGYDHILFIVALCAIYKVSQWKQILILVTAFTIGHSITLALATLDLISINTSLVEFLIPVTIVLTCTFNYFHDEDQADGKAMNKRYLTALFFGLIHGMGFSSYLKSLLGKSENIVMELLAFNIGLEAGQIVIVAITMLFTLLFTVYINLSSRKWNLILSGFTGIVSLYLVYERWGGLFE